MVGTYTLRVYAWTGGDGAGGDFRLDISRGPLGGSAGPPPPTTNQPPVATAGPDATYHTGTKRGAKATFTLNGAGSTDPDGSVVAYQWRLGSKIVGTTPTVTQSKTTGTYTYGLTVTDDDGATSSDQVTITVIR